MCWRPVPSDIGNHVNSSHLSVRVDRKDFDGKTVLADFNLQVGRGQIVALVGASGCGKSTLLRIVSGLDRHYAGEVRLDGQARHGVSRDIGFIFQEPRLLPWLTVAENIAFDAGDKGAGHAGVHPRAAALIERVGLKGFELALPKALSGGMAQRTAIARGLFNRPQLLLLDEPFSAVDAFTRMKLQDLLLDVVQDSQATLVLVTHDIDEAIYLADRVVILDNGPGPAVDDIFIDLPRRRDRRADSLGDYRKIVLDALEVVHAI
jgi:sulfonate transport system ATP-binding protein